MYHSAGQVEMSGMKFTGEGRRMSTKLNGVFDHTYVAGARAIVA